MQTTEGNAFSCKSHRMEGEEGMTRKVAISRRTVLGVALSSVNLSDGSYSTTKIYPVLGLPGHENGPLDRRHGGALGRARTGLKSPARTSRPV